jgi:hypothetical protein
MAKRTNDDVNANAEDVIETPKGNEDGPPSHEETLGAIAGAPEEVAKEYSETGVTPPSAWRDAQEAGVDLDKLKGHGRRGK